MKTIKKVQIEPVFVETIPDVLEQDKVYVSEVYKTTSHLCLCGCGSEIIIPFSKHPKHWQYENKDGRISLSPSIGNYYLPCQSHYILTKNVANFV